MTSEVEIDSEILWRFPRLPLYTLLGEAIGGDAQDVRMPDKAKMAAVHLDILGIRAWLQHTRLPCDHTIGAAADRRGWNGRCRPQHLGELFVHGDRPSAEEFIEPNDTR